MSTVFQHAAFFFLLFLKIVANQFRCVSLLFQASELNQYWVISILIIAFISAYNPVASIISDDVDTWEDLKHVWHLVKECESSSTYADKLSDKEQSRI